MGEQVADVSPSSVWMVNRETGPDGWRGTINLEEEALVFRPADGGRPREYAYAEIRRARRVRGTPVLELRLEPTSDLKLVGFFFVQPPSLDPDNAPGKVMKKRRARMAAVGKLHRWNAVKKQEIDDWVRAMSARRGGAAAAT